jgi:hypothetical protein
LVKIPDVHALIEAGTNRWFTPELNRKSALPTFAGKALKP